MGELRKPTNYGVRLGPNDPLPGYLKDKIEAGPGFKITEKMTKTVGLKAVLSVETSVAGSHGDVVVLKDSTPVPNTASLVLVDASEEAICVVLPHPAEVLGWLSVVCIDNSNPITFTTSCEGEAGEEIEVEGEENHGLVDESTKIFNKCGVEFKAPGDSFILASNRYDTWFPIARYSADWYC